jgi:hypothetical protein
MLRFRVRDPVVFFLLDSGSVSGMEKKSGPEIRDKHLGSFLGELIMINHVLCKILKFIVNAVLRIRDPGWKNPDPGWKNPDPESGINILDPQ